MIAPDGERQQKDLQGRRHAAADQGQDAQRKGDVRRRRNGPAVEGRGTAPVEHDVDECRYGHAADGGEDGQGALVPRRKPALQDLPFDFQADQKEKDRHKPVVDPQQQGLLDAAGADLDDHRRCQHGVIN